MEISGVSQEEWAAVVAGVEKGKRGRFAGELRLVPVDLSEEAEFVEASDSSRWLEAELPSGVRLRFLEGTEGSYVADLLCRLGGRGTGC